MAGITERLSGRRAAGCVAEMFSCDLTEQQAQAIQKWRHADSEHQQDFLDIVTALADMEALADHPDVQALVEQSRQVDRKQPRSGKSGLAVAVGILLVAVATVFSWLLMEKTTVSTTDNIQRYVTRIGEQKEISLVDGSKLTLNTGSEILVHISDDLRRISLKRGEVFFDVASELSRSFVVEIDSRVVTVLGTEFSLRKTPETFTLAVTEGVVAVHRIQQQVLPTAPVLTPQPDSVLHLQSPSQHRVTAGTVVEFDVEHNALSAYWEPDIERFHSWRNGLLRFEDERFSNVVGELNRYSAKKILIEDAAVMNLKIYAAVRIDRIETALTDLEQAMPIKVINHFDRIVIKGK